MAPTRLCVLIVDDHVELRSMLKRMLRQMEYFEAYFEARDGEDAWEKLTKQLFDLVICDLDMPRLDGIGLLKRCQTDPVLKNVPFLIVSGVGKQGAVATAMEMGAYNFVVKPFSFNLLKKNIDEIFERVNSPEERLFRLTEQLKAEGRALEAIAKIEQFERGVPALKPKWMNLKGEVLMDLEEPERAAECFEKTIQMSEFYLAAYRNLAAVQQALGNPEQAVEALLKADQINPRDIERKLSLGRLLLQAGRIDEGKDFLEQAVRVASREDKRAVELKAAEAALESGCFDEAEKLFTSALEANPQNLHLYNRLGIALRRQGKHAEAEQCYRKALKFHPDNAITHYNLGVLHMQTKALIKATQSFQRALELDPGFKEAREMLDNLQDIKH
jgi:tetratricopeptide (TPR) repeat protein